MVDSKQRPKLVGEFIRQKREAKRLSQRALGQLFDPPVTTQFVSNLERGVTPLPPNHIPTLTHALAISEAELTSLLEREYALKLSHRVRGPGDESAALPNGQNQISIAATDYAFMRNLYDAYRLADTKTRIAFATVCESILNIPPKDPANHDPA